MVVDVNRHALLRRSRRLTPEAAAAQNILERMPYPVACLYREMLEEKDLRIKFRCLIKVFVVSLKYVSMICIADYMRNPESTAVNNTLSRSLEHPSLGHWMTFLRSIANHYRMRVRKLHVQELEGVLQRRTNRILEHLIHLRNTYVHPDILPSHEQSGRLYAETLPHLNAMLEAFMFIADYPLVRRLTNTGIELLAMGADVPPAGEGPTEFLVRSTRDGFDLDVTAFMFIDIDEDFRDLLVYETLIDRKCAKYIMGNHVRFVAMDDEPDNRVRLLQDMLSRFASEENEHLVSERSNAQLTLRDEIAGKYNRGLALFVVKKLARSQSEEMFSRYRRDGRYNAATYVQRKTVGKAYEALLGGPQTGLVIVADSGAGKSNEICRLYIEKLLDDIVWIISGRTTRAGRFLDAIENQLFSPGAADRDVGRVLARIDRERTRERFVILVDGLNETKDPVEAFAQINAFIDANPYEWLKVIVTCRRFAWKTIESSGVVPDKRRYVLATDGRLAIDLAPFDDAELAQAFDRYSAVYNTPCPPHWRRIESRDYLERKFLRSPLILRFVFEAFSGREIPVPLDVDKIMTEFTRERLRLRDLPFLENYLMTYCYHEETDVLDSRLLIETTAGEPRARISKQERVAYDKLVEHVCGEQVDDIDEVWCCSEPLCSNHLLPLLPGGEDPSPTFRRCPRCHAPVVHLNVDNRSTFSRLLSENIVAQSDFQGHILVRMVFDRYFEYLMRRHCFFDKMAQRYDAAVVNELFEKSTRCGIFIDPLKGIILSLWQAGDPRALLQVANKGNFISYQLLRDVFEEYAGADFSAFVAALRAIVAQSEYDTNICRAGVHALLVEPHRTREHAETILGLLLDLGQCASERVHEDVAEYLVNLRRGGVDLFTPLIEGCCALIGADLGILRCARLSSTRAGRRRLKGQFSLLVNIVLFGLGNFLGDAAIRGSVVRHGLQLIQRVLRHPLLGIFDRFWARLVSREIARIYMEKGPLPCNYWEMLLQLRKDPDAIRRAGDLYFIRKQNLFDLDYDRFVSAVHSENGLITWYMLSLLPAHYLQASDRDRAVRFMHCLVREGSEMDRYIIGNGISHLLQDPNQRDGRLEGILEALERHYLEDPSQIFLHPKPVPADKDAVRAADYNQRRTEEIRLKSNPFALPWIVLEHGELRRFYINSAAFNCVLLRMSRDHHDEFSDILSLLKRNTSADLLRFGDDITAGRRFFISFLIQTLAMAAAAGYLKETFATLDGVIQAYITEARDPANIDVYRFALAATLKHIKEYHRCEVLAFIDRYDIDQERFGFLGMVKTAAVEKEKLFSKSRYLQKIYQGCFSSSQLREAFGEFTRRAAGSRDVEEFFFVYALSFMRWMKTIETQEKAGCRPRDSGARRASTKPTDPPAPPEGWGGTGDA